MSAAPLDGPMTSARPLRHRVEYAAFRVLRRFWRLLPEPALMRLAELTGLFAASVLRIRRREVDEHLARAFPDRPRRWRDGVARASYAHLAREAATLFRMPGWSRQTILGRVTFEGFEGLRRAVEDGRGAVLLTAHLGNWEVAGAAVAAAGVPLHVVGKGMANRSFEADLFRTREAVGMRVIDMTDAAKQVLRALGRGGAVAMLADQNAHRSGVFVPFFGMEAATHRGPALFAIRTGAPVFFGVAVREPGRRQRYVIRLQEIPFTPTGDAEVDTRTLLARYTEAVEESVKSVPEQYFWHHRRWRTRPPEEQPSAG